MSSFYIFIFIIHNVFAFSVEKTAKLNALMTRFIKHTCRVCMHLIKIGFVCLCADFAWIQSTQEPPSLNAIAWTTHTYWKNQHPFAYTFNLSDVRNYFHYILLCSTEDWVTDIKTNEKTTSQSKHTQIRYNKQWQSYRLNRLNNGNNTQTEVNYSTHSL